MELYGLENEKEWIGNITEICKLLGIECSYTTSKNLHKNPKNTRKNPKMAGIPIRGYPKYVRFY